MNNSDLKLLTAKVEAWLASRDGRKAIDDAIEQSNRQQKRFNGLQCVDPKAVDRVVNF